MAQQETSFFTRALPHFSHLTEAGGRERAQEFFEDSAALLAFIIIDGHYSPQASIIAPDRGFVKHRSYVVLNDLAGGDDDVVVVEHGKLARVTALTGSSKTARMNAGTLR